MKRLRNKYPLKQLLQDLKEELNQNEIITMEHLLECRRQRLLDFDDNYVYGYVDISEWRSTEAKSPRFDHIPYYDVQANKGR